MHLISIVKLGRELRDGRVSERKKLIYMLFGFLLALAVGTPGLRGFLVVNSGTSLFFALALLNTLGIVWCYRANERGDDRGFIERFVILGVPANIMFLVFYYGAYALLQIVGVFPVDAPEANAWGQWLLYAVGLGLFFYGIRRGITVASSGDPFGPSRADEVQIVADPFVDTGA